MSARLDPRALPRLRDIAPPPPGWDRFEACMTCGAQKCVLYACACGGDAHLFLYGLDRSSPRPQPLEGEHLHPWIGVDRGTDLFAQGLLDEMKAWAKP